MHFGLIVNSLDRYGALEINESMPDHMITLLEKAAKKAGKRMSDMKVAVLGVAYKPDVDDARDTPALKIINLLKGKVKEVLLDYFSFHTNRINSSTNFS